MRARGLKLRDRRVARHAPEVAPHAGAWIETSMLTLACCRQKSRPMRARGLKLDRERYSPCSELVAPHAGAWIETRSSRTFTGDANVAPHAGAWIETTSVTH